MFTKSRIAYGLVILGLIAIPWMVNPYIQQIFILAFTYSMLGLAFGLTIKVGLPRFDVAAWFGIGAYSTALFMDKAGFSFWPSILLGGVIAVVLGWIIFAAAVPKGMIVFLMFGMATAMTIYQIFGSVAFFGGWGGTSLVSSPSIGSFVFISKASLYYLGLALLILNILVYYFLYSSRIGRAWNAIGSSQKLASSVGINVNKYRIINILIGNFFIALAGGFFVAYSLIISPSNFSLHSSILVLLYVFIGGYKNSLAGPIVGSFVLTFTPEYFRIAKEYESIFTAIITILIILFLPNGILSLPNTKLIKRIRWSNWFPFWRNRQSRIPLKGVEVDKSKVEGDLS